MPPPPPPNLRSSLARRSPLLLLGAALAALAVLVVGDATPASADEPRAGDLDRTFSGDGRVTTDFGTNVNRIYNRAHAVAVQPDGKIVAAGYAANDFALTRYNANGTLDTSFGTGGRVRTDIGGGEDKAYALALQSDGKIVVAGEAVVSGTTEFAVARYNADGTPDTGFGSDGKATVGFGNADRARAVAIDNSGKIVVAGYSLNIIAVARYNADGTLDTSFSSDGKLTTRIANSTSVDRAHAVAVQSNNKIVVAGQTNSDAALVRYNNDGSLDTSFGSGGKVTTPHASFRQYNQSVQYRSIAIQSDGKIVAAGDEFAGSDQDFALARYTSSGALDTTFGSSGTGTVVTDFGSTEDFAYSVAQSGGNILVGGVAGSGKGGLGRQVQVGNGNFALARYTSAGQLDPGFGSGGKVVTDFGHNDHGRALAIQSDGNIVLAGFTVRNLYEDFAVARYLWQGAPSKDASLHALAVTQGPNANAVATTPPFRPTTFSRFTTSYTALLAADTTHVKVTPIAGFSNAKILVTGGGERQRVISGQPSTAIPVAGFSRIVVEVTAEDGRTQQTYTIDLRRGANEASLTNLKVEYQGQSGSVPLVIGEFHPERTSYSGVMPYSTGSEVLNNIPEAVTLIPTFDLPTSTVTVNGEALGGSDYPSDLIPLNVGDNVITVRVTAGDGVTTRDYTVNVRRLAPAVEEWEPTFNTKDLGGKRGCQNGVSGAECSDAAVLSESRFSVHSGGYGHAETTNYRVEELSVERVNQVGADRQFRVVLTVASDWTVELKNMVLVVEYNGQQYRLPFRLAKRSGSGRTFTWLEWTESPTLVWGQGSAPKVRMQASRTGLDTVRVYYDEMRAGQPVEGFTRWDIAREKPYNSFYHDDWDGDRAHIAVIPGEFPSLNPAAQGRLLTTHVRLRLAGTTPGSRVQYEKGAYNDSPPFFFFNDLPSSGITEPIELDPASKNTYVWVKVSHGVQGIHGFLEHTLEERVHLVIIDPPPRTFSVNPELRVTEGETGQVTVSLGSPATRGGVSFNVSTEYGDGVTDDDIGGVVSTVTVPEGQRSATITVPTIDDEEIEADERLTITLTHVGEPLWVVEPGKSSATEVTIVNDDVGLEPWNIQVVPGDGTLTVTWNVTSREGYEDSEIWHVLRWSQEFGVWANPRDPRAVGKNDGLSVDPGLTSYTITGLKNDVATGVFIRSMVGYRSNMSERNGASSKWVRTKGVHTTPVGPANGAPTLANPIPDATIANERGAKRIALAGVFTDTDGDELTITSSSTNDAVATGTVSADGASLTVTAKSRGSATITVTASDGKAEVSDTFTVTVKAAPTVASALTDIGSLAIGTSQGVSLTSVFSDADNDTLTLSASSSANAVATVSVATDGSRLTVTGVAEGTATITVTAQDSDGNSVSDTFDVTVPAANKAPTVASALSDATIVNESGTKRVSLSGVFTDADSDSLTIMAKTSAAGVATVSVAADYSSLTVTAKSRGTAAITVTASDGEAEVSDTFTVTVKAAPTVASALSDIGELAAEASQEISLSGVFSDADGDALTLSAVSSSNAVATVVAQPDPVTASATAITVTGVSSGTATITVTARDSDGNQISDQFEVTVPAAQQQQIALPGPVINLTLTAEDDKVVVSWTAPEVGSAPKGYIVHLKPEGGETGSGKIKRPKAKKTQVTFNNIEPGTTYNVWVRAQNESGKGERVYATITLRAAEPE